MNHIAAKYSSEIFINHKVKSFEVTLFGSKVLMKSTGKELSIDIRGRKNLQKLHDLLGEIKSLMFFYMGSFPLII